MLTLSPHYDLIEQQILMNNRHVYLPQQQFAVQINEIITIFQSLKVFIIHKECQKAISQCSSKDDFITHQVIVLYRNGF